MTQNFYIRLGIFVSPIVLLGIFLLKSVGKKEVSQQVEQKPIVDFQFTPTIPVTPIPNVSFGLYNEGTGTCSTVDMSKFKGKPTIIHFWAPWCTFCLDEMPKIATFSKNVEKDINVVIISSDQSGGGKSQEFYNKSNITHTPLYVDMKGDFLRAFKLKGLPSTIFVNQKGEEIGRVAGPIAWDKEAGDLIKKSLTEK